MADPSPAPNPRPRRPFELASTPTEAPEPTTPSPRNSHDSSQTDLRQARIKSLGRTRSFLNLTSSTLRGIYSPTENAPTPFENGSLTPSHSNSVDDSRPPIIGPFQKPGQTFYRQNQRQHQHRTTFLEALIPIVLRTILLFIFGVAYGVIVIHLHDNRHIAPVKVEGIERYSWRYLLLWGTAGVLLGRLLPWVDWLWDETVGSSHEDCPSPEHPDQMDEGSSEILEEQRSMLTSRVTSTAGWIPVARSIGAFVGIALAIVSPPIH